MAGLCLVASVTLATAATMDMTCVQDNGKGSCTAGYTPDGRTIVVVGPDVHKDEPMACEDKGYQVACTPVRPVSEPAAIIEMTCAQDNGKGSCTAGYTPDGRTIVVVGPDVHKDEPMTCEDKGYQVACTPVRAMKQGS